MPDQPKWECVSIEPDGNGQYVVKMVAYDDPKRTLQFTTAPSFSATRIRTGSLYHVNLVPAMEDIYA